MHIRLSDEGTKYSAEVETEQDGTVWFWIERIQPKAFGGSSFSAWLPKEYALKLAQALTEAAQQ
jgi:hypothetical protein